MEVIKTRAAFVIIKRKNPTNGRWQFLVMWSTQLVATKRRPEGHKMLKFPSGSEKFPGEPPAAIANREVREETRLAYLESVEIRKETLDDDHERYGYLLDFGDCYGEMRTWEERDGNELLGPPHWVDAADLYNKNWICEGHRDFCGAGCRFLGIL